jgi:hypothetical protein
MRRATGVMLAALVAMASVLLLTFGATMTSAVALAAAVATCPAAGCVYIVKGTNSAFNQIPDSAYPQFAYTYDTAVGAPAPTPLTTPYPYFIVPYPAAFWPITPPGYIFSPTFDESVATGVNNLEGVRPVSTNSPTDVLWGYSQGATVVTQYKRDYNAQVSPPAQAPTFVLVANPNRPNGGILERGVAFGTIPIVGVTFSGATPTTTAGQPDGTITTYDIARQYDGIADAPVNPLNVIADANAAMGFYYLHGQYPNINPAGPNLINQGTYGDTQYYLIATYPLPLLMPLESIPVIGFALADTLDPPLRVIVESAYDRSSSPGVPAPANPLYFPNPATFGTNLLLAIPVGLDNGVSDFTGSRPLATSRPGAFGVGGPSTPVPTPTPVSTPTIPGALSSPGGQSTGATGPNQQVAPKETVNGGGIQVPADNAVPQQLSNDNQSSDTKSRPRLNVSRPPLWVASGSRQGASSTNGSQSTDRNPTGSALSGVTQSISSALGGLPIPSAGYGTE